jgi:hypothetical protein
MGNRAGGAGRISAEMKQMAGAKAGWLVCDIMNSSVIMIVDH